MDRPIPWWLRLIFLFVAAQAFLFLIVFFRPDFIPLLEPWKASPLNARFIASLYTATGIGVLLCSMARKFREVYIVLFGIGLATGVLFLLTLFRIVMYQGELVEFPFRWMLFYFIDPILVAFAFWRLYSPVIPRKPNQYILLWLVETLVLGGVGLLMVILPGVMINIWPWELTQPLSQLYGAFFVALAVVTGLSMREPSWEGVRIGAVMLMTLGILVLIISSLHVSRFKSNVGIAIWFGLFAFEALIFGWLLIQHQVRPSPEGATQ